MGGEIVLWIVAATVVVALLLLLLRSRDREQASVADLLAPPPRPGSGIRPGPADGAGPPGSHSRSAPAAPDGSAPSHQFVIKGDSASMRYHTPGSAQFTHVRADMWFRSAADAEAEGFVPAEQPGPRRAD